MSQPAKIFILILIVCLVFGGVMWGNSYVREFRTGNVDEITAPLMDNTGRGTEDPDSVTIAITGNLFCDRRYQKHVYSEDSGGFSFADTLEYVGPILKGADLAVGNLETCVSVSNPYSMDMPNSEGGTLANAPASFLEALKNAGFNGLLLSGEHNCDFGSAGIRETIEAVEKRGFYHTGLYDSPNDKHYFMYEAKGFRIAFLSFTGDFGDSLKNLSYEEQEYMLSGMDTGDVLSDIQDAREAGADYVIVYVNKGSDYPNKVTDSQKETLRLMAVSGADYVIGSQGYVLQRTGYVKRNGVKVRCVYNMGTFTGFLSNTETRNTAILKLKIRRGEDGSVRAGKGTFIPCRMTKTWNGRSCVLIPEGTECSSSMNEKLDAYYSDVRKSLNIEK